MNESKLREQIREIIKEQLNEKTFGSQAQYDAYRKKHTLKPGTKVKVAGKTVTVRGKGKMSKKAKSLGDRMADKLNKRMADLEKKRKQGKIKEGLDIRKLENAIMLYKKAIKKQGRVTNARDEEHLKQLIKVYKQMGGKKIKEGKLSEQKLMKILLNKKDMSKLQKAMKKYPFKSLPKFKQKGNDIELNVPKKEYNKAVEFLMKNKLNPRG